MAITDFINKAKNIFSGNGSVNVNTTNDSAIFQQMVHLLTGDNCKGKTYTYDEIMMEYKSWVYACSNINAAGVASTPLRLYATTSYGQSNKYLHNHRVLSSKEVKELSNRASYKALSKITPSVEVVEVVDHPLLDLLRKFNDDRNYYESIEGTSISLDMIGNAYWYMDFAGMSTPQELYVMMPQHMTIVAGKRRLIKGYIYKKSGVNGEKPVGVKFKPSEIIHFKTASVTSDYYGLGPAMAAAMAIERNELIDISENSALKNKARPDAIVQYKGGKLDPTSKRDVEKMWNKAVGGPQKNGKIKVMDEDFDIKAMPGWTPEEMKYMEGRIWTLKEIAAIYGVPYSMLDSSDTKKATSESAKLWHTQNAIVPRTKRLEEKLNEKLVPLYDDRLFLMFDDPTPENLEQKTTIDDKNITNGSITINEVRRSNGLVPYEDEKFDSPFASGGEVPEQLEDFQGDNKPVESGDSEGGEDSKEDNNEE